MHNRISAAAAALTLALAAPGAIPARAYEPTVAELDAASRAAGNRPDVAVHIGRTIFGTTLEAQVSQISANQLGTHLVVGIRVWGVKFHHPLTREAFLAEVGDLVNKAFAAEPHAEEVDLWASVPIEVGKDTIVSGDLAKPTTRTVFSISVRRGETAGEILARARRGDGVFWDAQWASGAFEKHAAGGS